MRCPDQQSLNAIAADMDTETLGPENQPNDSDLHPLPDPDAHLKDAERKAIGRRLLWRLDMKLLPWLCFLYLLAFLDRANIGNAKVAGLTRDLNLSTIQFNATLTIFFVSYSVFEPLTNVLLKKFRPSIFLPLLMISFGSAMLGMGFVHNWSGLMAARWFLGLAEAGLFPGISLYLSCWYKRSELGLRTALFFSSAAIAGSFGGLLAAAIANMDGVANIAGWSWIFILEGLLTIAAGIASFWAVYDFPDDPKTKFLTAEEKARAINRLKEDHQSSAKHEKFDMMYVYQALRDWKMWLGMMIYSGCTMPLYAFSMFLPTVIHDLGLSSSVTQTQLYSAPPYIAGALFTILTGYLSDKYSKRGIFNVVAGAVALAGFSVLLASSTPGVKYTGTFLAALGIYPCIPNTISWMSNNVEGVYKRGIVLGFVIGWGNLNGIISSNIFFSGPNYIEGHATIIGYLSIFLLGGSLLMMALLHVENKARQSGSRDAWLEGKSEDDVNVMGDRRPDFVYTI